MIVGFQGRKRAGKNEAAHRLAQLAAPVGWDVEFFAFADSLKDTVCDTFGVSRERLDMLKDYDETTIDWNGGRMTWRELLQLLGTAVRVRFGEVWVDRLPADLDHSDRLILVTDARQPMEVARVRELGGVIVRIEGGEPFDGHESELLPDEPDYVIDNTARSASDLDAQLVRLWWWLACGSPALA